MSNIRGQRVLGDPPEIQEARDAFEAMDRWGARSEQDLLEAHERLMRGLVEEPGRSESGGVSILLVVSGSYAWHDLRIECKHP